MNQNAKKSAYPWDTLEAEYAEAFVARIQLPVRPRIERAGIIYRVDALSGDALIFTGKGDPLTRVLKADMRERAIPGGSATSMKAGDAVILRVAGAYVDFSRAFLLEPPQPKDKSR